jgi:hypothetical protein
VQALPVEVSPDGQVANGYDFLLRKVTAAGRWGATGCDSRGESAIPGARECAFGGRPARCSICSICSICSRCSSERGAELVRCPRLATA